MFDLSMCLILSFEYNIHLCVDQYQKYFETRVIYSGEVSSFLFD